jgi:UTP--glucose-1-phosphate uridylyltransferase
MPKEMLTLVDRPLIQYAVEEAREAGIEQFIFVTGPRQGRARGPFRLLLRARGDDDGRGKSLDVLQSTADHAGSVVSVASRSRSARHAVWCARDIVGDEPFAVLLPDDLIASPAASRRWSRL